MAKSSNHKANKHTAKVKTAANSAQVNEKSSAGKAPSTEVLGAGSEGSSTSQASVAASIVVDGKVINLSPSQFGTYVSENYSLLQTSFPPTWIEGFKAYRENHIMSEVYAKLKQGMDEVSCYNIDHHENMMMLASISDDMLIKKNSLLNEIDRKLIARYEEIKNSNNFPFLHDVNMEWGSCFTNLYGLYDADPQAIERVRGKAILDVGAFIGDTVSTFRALIPESKIYSFEPSSHNIEELKHYFANDISAGNLIPVQKGCGDKPAKLTLSKKQGVVDAMASVANDYKTELTEEVEVIRIDDFVKEHNLEVGVLKIDVEGFEPQVIEGALNTIKEQTPILLIAFYHHPQEFYELKPYLESLNLGYHFEARRSCISSPLADLILVGTKV